jgi:hypothetical protein
MDDQASQRRCVLQGLDGLLILQNCSLSLDLLTRVHPRQELYLHGFDLNSLDQVSAVFFFQFSRLNPLENRTVGVSIGREPAGTSDDGTEPLTRLNTITSWMRYLTLDLNGRAHIIPSRQLPDGKNIAVVQTDIGVGLAFDSFGDQNGSMVGHHLAPVLDHVAGKIGFVRIGAALQPARESNQICGRHLPA